MSGTADDPAICAGCGVDTAPCTGRRGCRHAGRWEYYMVRDAVWLAAVPGYDARFLCVGCMEERLGRRLTSNDFTGAPINDPDPWDTPRLAARKSDGRIASRRRLT